MGVSLPDRGEFASPGASCEIHLRLESVPGDGWAIVTSGLSAGDGRVSGGGGRFLVRDARGTILPAIHNPTEQKGGIP
jgi:hypothetical protein